MAQHLASMTPETRDLEARAERVQAAVAWALKRRRLEAELNDELARIWHH